MYIDLLKINSVQFNENYFYSIISSCYSLTSRLSHNSSLIDNVFTSNLSIASSAYILNVHRSDHQPVIPFIDNDLSHKKLKYITIKTNSEEAIKYFRSSFKNKIIIDLLDRNIYATDPNKNYEVLERTLKKGPHRMFSRANCAV